MEIVQDCNSSPTLPLFGMLWAVCMDKQISIVIQETTLCASLANVFIMQESKRDRTGVYSSGADYQLHVT